MAANKSTTDAAEALKIDEKSSRDFRAYLKGLKDDESTIRCVI